MLPRSFGCGSAALRALTSQFWHSGMGFTSA
jgi:hypothetical protein